VKVALIEATENWETLTGGGGPAMSSHVHLRGHTRDEGAGCKTEKGGADSRLGPEFDWLRGGRLGAH
jgi:hypothetical protein